jgi:hypothetical protein
MRYAELFEEQAPGTYVGVRFSSETVEGLKRYQDEYKVPNPLDPEKFHTTVVYSREPIKWEAETKLEDEECAAKGFTVFDARDGTKCLVLLLDSEYLHDRFDHAIEVGASYDFPDYKPHITLSYDIGHFDIKKLPTPDFDITLDHEYVEELKKNWNAS